MTDLKRKEWIYFAVLYFFNSLAFKFNEYFFSILSKQDSIKGFICMFYFIKAVFASDSFISIYCIFFLCVLSTNHRTLSVQLCKLSSHHNMENLMQ